MASPIRIICTFLVVVVGFTTASVIAASINSQVNENGPVVKQLTAPVELGEGPYWDEAKKVLYFVDIAGKKLYRYDPQTTNLTFASFDEPVSAVFLVQNTTNRFYVGAGKTLTEVTWDGENTTQPCTRKLHTVNEGYRFNDGKADSTGRLWLGTQTHRELPEAALYRLSGDICRLEPVFKNITYSNGITWSHDDKYMFYIDTITYKVVRYDYDIRDGSIKNEHVIIDFKKENIEGGPDGMTIDNNEDLWIACYKGSQVIKVNSRTGELLARIKIPVPFVTSVVFGDNTLQTLYVTTARDGLSNAELQKYPAAGALFSVSNLNVTGRLSNAVRSCVGLNNGICT